jgi:hypothetical protein
LKATFRLYPVGLHTSPAARLAAFGVRPFERKTKPRAITLERVVIDDNPDIWPLLPNLGDLCRVGLARYGSIAVLVMPNVV